MDGPPAPQSDRINLHNSPQPIHRESTDHVIFHRVHHAYELILPLSLVGVTLLGIVFVLVVLLLWWRNSAPWSCKDDRKMENNAKSVLRETVEAEKEKLDVKYVRETVKIKPVLVTTRSYGGSPKVPGEQKEEEKFLFPPTEQPSTSRQSERSPPDRSLPDGSLPEKSQLKPFPVPFYRAAVPRQLADVASRELAELTVQERTKKFSATRSPSLEKDDKSPFVGSSACDQSDVFTFEPDRGKLPSSANESPVLEVTNSGLRYTFDANFNNNATPVTPKPLELGRIPEYTRTSSLDAENENKEKTNLRRFRSVNTKLNIFSATDLPAGIQQEQLEMQKSPRIVESGSKFNFSPKLLDEHNSPKFFTPTDKFSPRFFPEVSPKSVYYDSVRSPKFFPDTPKSPQIPEERCSLSPKAFAETNNRNSPRNSPKLFVLEQHSPRILGKPRSPKVYSGNKENYFSFDKSDGSEEVDNASKKPHFQRYGGRKSIERERIITAEKHDARRYRRHNSCDTYNQNIDNGNVVNMVADRLEPIHIDVVKNFERIINIKNTPDRCDQQNIYRTSHGPLEDEERRFRESKNHETTRISGPSKGEDVIDCCVMVDAMRFSPKADSPWNINQNREHLHTAQQRRERLKSISLDSDNAKIIEQNLGLPIAKQIKQDNLDQALQDLSSSCSSVNRSGTEQTKFTFDCMEASEKEYVAEAKYSPDFQKKSLKDSNDTKSFIEMPRFSPKEFDVTITVEEDPTVPRRKGNKNLRNLTIDLTRRDSDLEKELLEFENLYTDSEEKKVKTPTLKIKATSLDSSESMNLSLPQKNTLEVPQNSVSVPNTPKRQHKRILRQKNLAKLDISGGKMGYNSLHVDHRRFMKVHEGIFLKENHSNLMLYQPSASRVNKMGSFDENMADFSENPPAISVNEWDSNYLGSNLFKPNMSVSSTNLKTLPEGVLSTDFDFSTDDKASKKLNRRGSNQSLKLSVDQGQKYSTYSLQSSNNSLSSSGLSCQNLTSIRNSASNFSLNTDNRQKVLERRNSNTCLSITDQSRFQSSNTNITEAPAKNCLLQRRGSNNSLTLNIQSSNTNLSRFSSNSSLNINKDAKTSQRKGLLERRSSNTSLTLNINTSNSQLTTCKGLSISNYNLNASTCNLSLHNSNHSMPEPKKGILERRSSNTSLTINIQPEVPRDIEVDENVLESNLKNAQFAPQSDKHRKSLSTENLLPKSYKTRKPHKESQSGSQDDLWSNSFVSEYAQNLTYVCGDPENEIIYAFGRAETVEGEAMRNITTKPLSPQTTSEDFKTYLANIQHLQNASSVLTRKQLQDINNVFQNGYSKVKCDGADDNGHRCSPRDPAHHIAFPETELPCSEYQKTLLRNLHREFWDLPSNFQEKPMVFGSHTKNRYKTILPNEHSRFILKADAGTGEGYINANFIKGHEYSKNSYIATQGPLQNTIYDFWLMVYQNSSPTFEEARGARSKTKVDTRRADSVDLPRVQKIVMLTNFLENNRQKCEKYFPVDYQEEMTFDNPEQVTFEVKTDSPRNSFVVTNTGVLKKTGYTIRKLSVKYKKATPSIKESYKVEEARSTPPGEGEYTTEETTVYHYWFHNWADHKCPKDVNSLLNLSLDIINASEYDFSASVQTLTQSSAPMEPTTKFVFPPLQETIDSCSSLHKPFSPVDFDDETSPSTIVHCSAGIGRTGCLIAILNGIKQLSFDQKVDILGIVCNMRLNRGGMVQTSEQYELIHKVLCLYEQLYLPNQ